MKRNGVLKGATEYSEHAPHFSEFFRLYNRIREPIAGAAPRVLMVTSSVAGEGKTTVAAYLGITAAMVTAENHVVIDADMNCPTLHRKLSLNRGGGLTELISGDLELIDAIQITGFSGLDAICAGKRVENPFSLLSLGQLPGLLEQLRQQYRMIILDSPPVLNLGDTLKLTEFVDGIIMVILSGRTNRQVVKRALELLRESHKPLLGVVLNDLGEALPYYYQQKYYSYHYQHAPGIE